MGLNIVQIGANKGNDDLSKMIKSIPGNLIDLLILVEPMTVHHQQLSECYRNIENKIIINSAICSSEFEGKVIQIHYHEADAPGYEVASLNKDHIRKHSKSNSGFLNEEGYKTIDCYGMSINKLFKLFSLTKIDILFIDAEGFDSDIVKSINFDNVRIENLYFENLHLPEGRQNENASVYDFLRNDAGMKFDLKSLSNGWMSHAFSSN